MKLSDEVNDVGCGVRCQGVRREEQLSIPVDQDLYAAVVQPGERQQISPAAW